MKLPSKIIALLFLVLLYQMDDAFGQNRFDEIKVIEAISNYNGNNSLCFQNGYIQSDSDTYIIIKSRSKNPDQFRKVLSSLNSTMPNLTNYYSKIFNFIRDSNWNNLISDWSISIPKRKEYCQYNLSIGRPIQLSSNSDFLVIITEYKHEAESFTFDALVYFYNVKRIGESWIVVGSDHVYDVMYDWRAE